MTGEFMKNIVQKNIDRLFENLPDFQETERVRPYLKSLPEPVQKYVKFARLFDREKIQTVHLGQKGLFRTGMNQKGFGFRAE